MKMPRFDAAVITVTIVVGTILGIVNGIPLRMMVALSLTIAALYGLGVYAAYYR